MRYLLIALFLFTAVADAKRLHPEKHYQAKWCNAWSGETEVVLHDKSSVDCLTAQYAVEVDFANKWAESIGQAVYYGIVTGKKPGIVLILEIPENDKRFLERAQAVTDHLDITLWWIKVHLSSVR